VSDCETRDEVDTHGSQAVAAGGPPGRGERLRLHAINTASRIRLGIFWELIYMDPGAIEPGLARPFPEGDAAWNV